jgi:hypothetical protein
MSLAEGTSSRKTMGVEASLGFAMTAAETNA